MSLLSSLSHEQKASIGLLQIGTFLEYFDLMLYMHMAVFLNELFFPKTDPHTASLLAAFALCSSLAFRPLGALIFGWIGDHIGRKPTIIITTTMMAISCIVMANLPTYAQIGITAAWLVTICRIIQGISSMGEVVGAEIYFTETISRPACFPVIASMCAVVDLGGVAALGVAFLTISFNMNWRLAFWIGAVIAVISAFARTSLKETPEFLATKKKWLKKEVQQMNIDDDPVEGSAFNAKWKEPIKKKTLLSYFFISCGVPLGLYLAFFHFVPILKENFGYSSEDVIRHNFFLAFMYPITNLVLAYLSYRIHPLKIQQIRSVVGSLLLLWLPFLITAATNPMHLFVIQSLLCIFRLDDVPSIPVFLSHFPAYCRFTCATLLFAVSRALMYVITSFGVIYLVNYWGSFGIWVVALPIVVAYLCSISHFKGLELKYKLYP